MRETEQLLVEGTTEALAFTDGPHAGIIFSYSKVSFVEDEANDQVYLKFDYDIHENNCEVFDKELFEKELGDHLQDLLRKGIEDNSIIYTGGV